MNDEALRAMNSLQKMNVSLPVLALFYAEGRLTLKTDACDVQVALVLSLENRHETTKSIISSYRSFFCAMTLSCSFARMGRLIRVCNVHELLINKMF